MTAQADSDLSLISFALKDPENSGVFDISSRLTASFLRLEHQGLHRADDVVAAVKEVHKIGMFNILDDLHNEHRIATVLFHVAKLLGSASATVAWHGLSGLPTALALKLSGYDVLELPLAVPVIDRNLVWVLLRPLVLIEDPKEIWLLHGRDLLRSSHMSGAPGLELSGFPLGSIVEVCCSDSQILDRMVLTVPARECLLHLLYALLGGVLSGVLKCLVEESYAYARIRKSAGKQINRHQAVMLKLADLAIQQQGLSLYLESTAECFAPIGCWYDLTYINSEYISLSVSRIAEDAVQVAGGNGYTERMKFKRLFCQAHTLASAIALLPERSRNP